MANAPFKAWRRFESRVCRSSGPQRLNACRHFGPKYPVRPRLLSAAAILSSGLIFGMGTQPTVAATLQWVQQLGTSENDNSRGVSTDKLGNVFMTGWTEGSLGGPNGGSFDAYVSKYDPAGNLQWVRQFGASGFQGGNGVSADGSGSVYVGGSAENWTPFVAKYDTDGVLQWSRQIQNAEQDEGRAVSADGLGNVYLSGTTSGPDHNLNAFLAKYDSEGAFQWRRVLSSRPNANGFADDSGTGVSADGLGNIYVTGHTNGNLGQTHPGGVELNAFLAKYDAAGTVKWIRQLGTSGYEQSFGVSADGSGSVYITGSTAGSLGGPNAGLSDAFVARYDAEGALQWVKQLGTSGTDESVAVSADRLGRVFISGRAATGDAYLTKLDAAGDLLWTMTLGTSASDGSQGVSADGLGNVYIAGTTTGSLGGTHVGVEGDAFVAKYREVPEPSGLTLAALSLIALRRVMRRSRN